MGARPVSRRPTRGLSVHRTTKFASSKIEELTGLDFGVEAPADTIE